MKIKVLGTGCFKCKKLYKDVEEIISELCLDANLEKIEDVEKIMKYGIMSVPALVINEKFVFAGKSTNKEELIKYITENNEESSESLCSNCNCK